MTWHYLTVIREALSSHSSCGNHPERTGPTPPLGPLSHSLQPRQDIPALIAHISSSQRPACSVLTSVLQISSFLPNSSPSLLIFAKMCCLQPKKINCVTLTAVWWRDRIFPSRTSQSCSQDCTGKNGMMHTGFLNLIWKGKTTSRHIYKHFKKRVSWTSFETFSPREIICPTSQVLWLCLLY